MNVFYNASTAASETDEYNWIYNSKANGGSGLCETSGNSTCLSAPLDENTGYTSYIVPLETRIDLGHVLNNDPRPHFIHQSNVFRRGPYRVPGAEQHRTSTRSWTVTPPPGLNISEASIGTELQKRSAFATAVAGGQVTGYRIGSTVTVSAPSGVQIEATMPTGTTQKQLLGSTAFGPRTRVRSPAGSPRAPSRAPSRSP